jgi:hypothetical protein
MKKFTVSCVHRETGAPYTIVVEAATPDAAKLIAAENHVAGAVAEYKAPALNHADPAVQLLAEVRELSVNVRSLNAKMPDIATLRASIRGGVFRAMIQWFVFVFVVGVLIAIFLALIGGGSRK